MRRVGGLAAILAGLVAWMPAAAPAQEASLADQQIDQIRLLETIGDLDKDRIRNWVQIQVDELRGVAPGKRGGGLNAAAFRAFRDLFSRQFNNPENTPAFREQFAFQTAAVAADELAKRDIPVTLAVSLARVLVDLNRPETVPGLLAGLRAAHPAVRYFGARGLADIQEAIAADENLLTRVVGALRDAAVDESSAVVLRRMYEALSLPRNVPAVFDAFLEIFDARLAGRRGPSVKADGAEMPAFEFFRTPEALGALNQQQQVELVQRLAVFLRMDAERYNDPAVAPPANEKMPDLAFEERAWLEQMLDANEEILVAIVGDGSGGKIREAFSAGGFANRAQVLEEAYRWVGNPETDTPGALNAEPWNVPVGAP